MNIGVNVWSCLACLALFSIAPAQAQTATAVGTGTATAVSRSTAAAVAVSGQGGAGGAAQGVGNVTVNGTPAVTATTTTVQGTQTVRNVPTVFAPGLAAAGLETCLGSVSAGVGVIGTGVSFGTSIPDAGCAARLDARTLWSFGLRKMALARLCLNPDIYRSDPGVCAQYLPQPPAGYVAAGYTAAQAASREIGAPVEVIMQATGEHRMCKTYDEIKHRCRAWAK